MDDGGEVVVEQDNVGNFAADVGAALSHGDADLRALERRRVVHAVAGHGHDLALRLQRFDDLQFLLRPHAREDVDLGKRLGQRGTLVVVKILARQHAHAGNADQVRHRQRGGRVIAGDHHHKNAGGEGRGDGAGHLRAGRIPEQGEAKQ